MSAPHEFIVTSASAIKVDSVRQVVANIWPASEYQVTGMAVPSDVNEQPLGQETIDGALNRLRHARECMGQSAYTYVSIENGLFRISDDLDPDLEPEYDPLSAYEDRVVIALSLPYQTVPSITISPRHEAVRFPDIAVRSTYSLPGGFTEHTVGRVLYETGAVCDMQDPHINLTHGSMPRRLQITRSLLRAIIGSAYLL